MHAPGHGSGMRRRRALLHICMNFMMKPQFTTGKPALVGYVSVQWRPAAGSGSEQGPGLGLAWCRHACRSSHCFSAEVWVNGWVIVAVRPTRLIPLTPNPMCWITCQYNRHQQACCSQLTIQTVCPLCFVLTFPTGFSQLPHPFLNPNEHIIAKHFAVHRLITWRLCRPSPPSFCIHWT